MGMQIEIYGSLIHVPDPPPTIEDWGTSDPKEQYWRRRELPDIFDNVRKDEEGNAILNEAQAAYAKIEVERCKRGFWFYNNGVPTYVTGKNYFYLQWWKLAGCRLVVLLQ